MQRHSEKGEYKKCSTCSLHWRFRPVSLFRITLLKSDFFLSYFLLTQVKNCFLTLKNVCSVVENVVFSLKKIMLPFISPDLCYSLNMLTWSMILECILSILWVLLLTLVTSSVTIYIRKTRYDHHQSFYAELFVCN